MDKILNFLETDWISLFSCLFLLLALLIYKLFWDGDFMRIFNWFKPTNLDHFQLEKPSEPIPDIKLPLAFDTDSYKVFQKQLLIDSNYELVEKE